MSQNDKSKSRREKIKERNIRRRNRHVLNNPTFWLMTIFCIIEIMTPFVLKSIDLNIDNNWKNFILFIGFDLFIGASSYLLYLAYNYKIRARIALKVIFSIMYFALCAIILYFAFNAVKTIYPVSGFFLFNEVIGYFFWAMFILTAIALFLFNLFYSYCWGPLNCVSLILVPILTPIAVIIIIYLIVLLILGKFENFHAFLANNSSITSPSASNAYTFTNDMGCQETVYSDDGKHFTNADGSYAGTSDDGGQTFHK